MDKKIFGVILAGGKGSRMGNTEKPKQYINIGGKPIILHTIEKFLLTNQFELLVVLVSNQWLSYTKDKIEKYFPGNNKIVVIEGGKSRNETLINAIEYINKKYEINDEDILVSHDSVRPFVSHRIIEDNIVAASKYGCCDTAIPATDTIVVADSNNNISEIPDRKIMFQGQTPQSFKIKLFEEVYSELTNDEKETLTDACKIFTLKNRVVKIVKGDVTNFKITYPFDVKVAEALIK